MCAVAYVVARMNQPLYTHTRRVFPPPLLLFSPFPLLLFSSSAEVRNGRPQLVHAPPSRDGDLVPRHVFIHACHGEGVAADSVEPDYIHPLRWILHRIPPRVRVSSTPVIGSENDHTNPNNACGCTTAVVLCGGVRQFSLQFPSFAYHVCMWFAAVCSVCVCVCTSPDTYSRLSPLSGWHRQQQLGSNSAQKTIALCCSRRSQNSTAHFLEVSLRRLN